MSLLELKNVTYIYNQGAPYQKVALNDVTLSIEKNMVTGIIGHTGSGKSTLVQLLNGLLKPTSGQVILDGVDIWKEPKKIKDVRFKVGLVMQYPEYQLFEETVKADIAFGPKNMHLPPEEIEARAISAANFVGLNASDLDKSPFDLSGGQKRRAAIAGVMAMSPELLVLDEPAAGLDPGGRVEILGKIKEYQQINNTSVIIVSHSMEDMAMYCDRVIVLGDGEVEMDGKPGEIFSQYEKLISLGLDVPQITHVANALKKYGIDIGSDVYTVEEATLRLKKYISSLQKGGAK